MASWEHKLRIKLGALDPDKANLVTDFPGSCRWCGRATEEHVIVRCSYCAKGVVARLVCFYACAVCGGAATALQQWSLHIGAEHTKRR